MHVEHLSHKATKQRNSSHLHVEHLSHKATKQRNSSHLHVEHLSHKATKQRNVFTFSIFMFFLPGLMERKLVLQWCLKSVSWGLLEMSILLTADVAEFDMRFHDIFELDTLDDWDQHVLGMQRQHFAPDIDVKLDYLEHGDWLTTLLISRCTVSNGIEVERISFVLEDVNILDWKFLYSQEDDVQCAKHTTHGGRNQNPVCNYFY